MGSMGGPGGQIGGPPNGQMNAMGGQRMGMAPFGGPMGAMVGPGGQMGGMGAPSTMGGPGGPQMVGPAGQVGTGSGGMQTGPGVTPTGVASGATGSSR